MAGGVDLPLGFVCVCIVADELNQNSTTKYLLLDQVILVHCQHGLDIILGITEDNSMAFLSTGLSSNRFDLNALHDRLKHTICTVFENVDE